MKLFLTLTNQKESFYIFVSNRMTGELPLCVGIIAHSLAVLKILKIFTLAQMQRCTVLYAWFLEICKTNDTVKINFFQTYKNKI